MAEKPDPHVAPESPKSQSEKKVENGGFENRHDLAKDISEDMATSTPDVEEGPLTEKEIKLLNEYKKADQLLEKAREKFVQAAEMLKNDPKGEPLKEAVRIYNEAREMIKNILPNLVVLDVEWGVDVSFVNDSIAKVNTKKEELKSEMMKVAGIDISDRDLSSLDFHVINGMAKNYEGGNVKVMIEVIKFLNVTTESELQELQALLFRYKLADITQKVEEMKKRGITGNYMSGLGESMSVENTDYTLLKNFLKSGENTINLHRAGITAKEMLGIAQELKKIGVADVWRFIMKVIDLANSSGEGFRVADQIVMSLKIKNVEELDRLKIYKNNYKLKISDITKRLKAMMDAGIDEGYLDMLIKTAKIEKPEYDIIAKFMPLRNVGLSIEEILDFSIRNSGRLLGEINFMNSLHKLIDVDGSIEDIYKIYLIKDHSYFRLKNKDIVSAIKDMKKAGVTEGYLDILNLMGKLRICTPSEYVEMGEYVKFLRNLGVKEKQYSFFWENMRDKNIVKDVIKLEKDLELSSRIYLHDGEESFFDKERKYELALTDAKIYLFQSKEMQDFIRDMLTRQSMMAFDSMSRFVFDPSLPICIEVYKNMDKKNVEEALRFGRTLYYQGIKTLPDRTTLAQKMKQYEEVQSKADKIKIFEGRNVVFLANGEKLPSGENRFYNSESQKALEKSVGPNGSKSFYAPLSDKPTVADLENVKAMTLKKIETTSPPMTFFFDGHGGPDALYMNNGAIVGTRPQGNDIDTISFKELAGAISKRKDKFSKEALAKDIYINAGCYNHTFIRNLYAEIQSLGGVAPITIGESEYGQLGSGDRNNQKTMYQFGILGTTIGNLRANESKYLLSNFTVYIPDEQGNPVQVVKGEEGQEGKIG